MAKKVKALNAKQKRFIDLYFQSNYNKTESYLGVYKASSSPQSANINANRILGLPAGKSYLMELQSSQDKSYFHDIDETMDARERLKNILITIAEDNKIHPSVRIKSAETFLKHTARAEDISFKELDKDVKDIEEDYKNTFTIIKMIEENDDEINNCKDINFEEKEK